MKRLSLILICGLFSAAGALAQNSITINKDAQTIKYNNMLFGQFIEHFDTQIYGGIFCPGNPLSDEDGFRTDVIAAMKELKVPIVRWPGGCFVSSYHWLDGVTNPRVPTYDKAWQVEDPNTFGTDEYIKWCRKVGCEPYICTNAGTGTAEEMSDWVEYCNQNMGKFALLRAKNGHPEPYNVKYWSIGNENYGSWEIGAKTVDEWGPLVRESAKMMLAVTKDAKLFAAANSNREWTLPLLKAAGQYLDYVSIHGYWDFLVNVNTPAPFTKCMMYTDGPERDILNTIDILKEAGLDKRVKIAFDEWNLKNWHHPGHGNFRKGFDFAARRNNDDNTKYTMADALFNACFFNACLRNADYVEIACFSPIVNTRGAIFVYDDGILKRSTYHTIWMYANLLEANVVPIDIASEDLVYENSKTKALDVIVTTNDAKDRYVVAIVNKNPEKSLSLKLDPAVFGKKIPSSVKAQVLNGAGPDDYNEVGAEDHIIPREKALKLSKDGSVSLEPHSLTFITIE